MDVYIDKIRIIIQSIVIFIMAFLSPIQTAVEVLLVAATIDFVAGLAGNVWTGNERFRIGKAFGAIYKIIAYLLVVILAHFATDHMGEQDVAMLLVKYLTFLIIYWYMINILSNLRMAFPRSSGIAFLYLLLSLKVLPLILDKVGLGGSDIQDLAEKARKVSEGDEKD